MTIDVRPEEIHLCATKIIASGEDWGEAYSTLDGDVANQASLYASDTIGQALHAIFDPFVPKALMFTKETGFAVIETGSLLDRVAADYTDVESDNTALSNKVQAEVDRLGR